MSRAVLAILAAVSICNMATAGAAHGDCGDQDQPPCTGPVPTTDQVLAIMTKLTDPDIPAADKADVVTPAFNPDEAGTIDDHLNRMNARRLLPLNFEVSDIQSAPANFAGATVKSHGYFHQRSANQYIVLADQDGHWRITNDTAMTTLDHFWYNAKRPFPVVVP